MKYWTTKSGLKIFRILGGRCNCYLVSTGNHYLLMDTGRTSSWYKFLNQTPCRSFDPNQFTQAIPIYAVCV